MRFFDKGSWPAVMTAFAADGSVDYSAQEALLDHYIATDASGLFINCYSSELFYLSVVEQLELARHALRHTAGRVEVVSGAISSGSIETQYALIDQLLETGVDGLIIGSNQLAAEDESDALLIERLQALIERFPNVRWGIYEIPFPYKRVLSDEALRFCAASGRFFFLKDTCCDADRIRNRAGICDGSPLRLFNAHLGTLELSLRVGYAGYCGVLSNLIPQTVADICTQFRKRDDAAVAGLAAEASYIDEAILGAGIPYPLCAKAFLAANGVAINDYCRMPPEGDASRVEATVTTVLEHLNGKGAVSHG